MDQATGTGLELSLLKTANVSGFLLELDTICNVITTARECVSGCGVESNPFALESMTTICSIEAREQVQSIGECLVEQGEPVLERCTEECGDYDQLNVEVHRLTEAFRPETNRQDEVSVVMKKINEACGALKCSDRCTVKELSQRCPAAQQERDAGAVVQSLIQRVLVAQRRDLDRMRLVEMLAQSTPEQCTYMYVPEVMFDPSKDQLLHHVVSNEMSANKDLQRRTQPHQMSESERKNEITLALSQLQAHLLKKQMHLLDIQEKNLIRESQKLDLELEMLIRKRAKYSAPLQQPLFPRL